MTTQELKKYINKTLGNSIRCLLPSYWWKKLFGLVVDKIDEVDSKFDDVTITSDTSMSDSSTNPVQNKVIKAYVDDAISSITVPEITIDDAVSYTSTNPVQNKVVTNALGGYTLVPLANAKEFITSYFSNEKPRARGLINSVSSDTGNNYSEVIGLKYGNNLYSIYFTLNGRIYRWIYDGTTYNYIRDEEVSDIVIDTDMSDSSTNPVQNKVITAALNLKVDKVEGKQLSTEDFTTLLKTKLEGLSNYDDTEINNAISALETQLNTDYYTKSEIDALFNNINNILDNI